MGGLRDSPRVAPVRTKTRRGWRRVMSRAGSNGRRKAVHLSRQARMEKSVFPPQPAPRQSAVSSGGQRPEGPADEGLHALGVLSPRRRFDAAGRVDGGRPGGLDRRGDVVSGQASRQNHRHSGVACRHESLPVDDQTGSSQARRCCARRGPGVDQEHRRSLSCGERCGNPAPRLVERRGRRAIAPQPAGPDHRDRGDVATDPGGIPAGVRDAGDRRGEMPVELDGVEADALGDPPHRGGIHAGKDSDAEDPGGEGSCHQPGRLHGQAARRAGDEVEPHRIGSCRCHHPGVVRRRHATDLHTKHGDSLRGRNR